MTLGRVSWRTVAATWGGAVMLVTRQFGVPASGSAIGETRIVRIAEAGELRAAAERTADGRILTLPIEPGSDHQRQDDRRLSDCRFAVN
ncbi:MAG TPA: hypothetical protein VGR22_01130 [Thermomicrobiales bacterium]|nr:hypothetical protein [Thermomicrobiales bacterium]